MANIIVSSDWWTLYENGLLDIYCNGDMPNYNKTNFPWYDYKTQITSVTIRDSVTSIGNSVFYDCSGLTSVAIPDSVTSIGSSAFNYCTSLTSVTIGNGVTSIGNFAFDYCTSLTSVTIPDSVTSIKYSVFRHCSGLIDVYYTGTETQWNAITIGNYNAPLTSATIHYNYAPATLLSIAITTPPTKTAYTAGETFDPSGMVVTATYSDDSTAAVSDYSVSPSGNLATSDSSATVSYTENDVTKTAMVAITVTAQEPEMPPSTSWPRTALNVMKEIAARIGTPLDPRTVATLSAEDVEDTALKMTMKEVAGYIAAMNAGNWTITDEGNLYLVPLGAAQQAEADISAHNAESLSVSDPLEAWSGVRVIWDGEEWDASGSSEDGEIPVKSGDQIGFAGDESGRVLEIKVAFGQYAHPDPAHLWDRGAERILSSIRNNAYFPFEAQNVILDPACGIGDAVTVPGGTSLICSMSGELDGLCAVDASAPPDEAINTAYPANWQAASSGERVTGSEVEQIVTDAWNAASDG